MPFRQNIEDCLAEAIGEGGLPRAEYEAVLAETAPGVARLGQAWREGRSRLLAQPGLKDDLAGVADIVRDWRGRYGTIYLLGIGGSSMGARALAQALAPAEARPRLVVLDDLDPGETAALADPGRLAESGVLVVSKSGGTDETLAQALIAADTASRALGPAAGEHFLMLTEPGERPLRRLAQHLGARVLDHESEIDGRYSVLSLVGMLPALFLGIDAGEVRAGAERVLAANLAAASPADAPAAQAAALAVGLNRGRGINQSVLMPYSTRLAGFARWYRQLWAESLGKDGQGTTPVDAVGPVDQHSQLQLYLDGPWDKMFTVLTLPRRGQGPAVDADLAEAIGLAGLGGHPIGDLLAAMQRATADTLAKRGRPVRRIELERLEPETLGGLFMHFILETLLAADLLGVDPFGQPAVEAGKQLARRYLAEAGGGNGAAAKPERVG